MRSLLVVDDTQNWPAQFEEVRVVTAWDYLTKPEFHRPKGQRIFNLCESYRYQSSGYYVSLLASARGQRPLPDVTTIQDLRWRSVVRDMTQELDELIQRSLRPLTGTEFVLSIYFGRNLAERYKRLATAIFNLLPAPLLRASFKSRAGNWRLTSVAPIPLSEVPQSHREFLHSTIAAYFKRPIRLRRPEEPAYDLAILVNPEEELPPSNPAALRRFERAAEEIGFDVQLITKHDFGRIAEFDALFIRETTRVNHYTYRLARRAAVEGLVVIDDPQSILRCANKVFLFERLRSFGLPAPATSLLHRQNALEAAEAVGFPCILKPPDESFSRGMRKVDTREELGPAVAALLEKSDLIVAQAFLPTTFDWRVGVLEGEALYVCRYFMAENHWQIYRRDDSGRVDAGDAETLAVADAPSAVVELAVAAAKTVGDGLYGVDIKEHDGRCFVVEINDNPNIDAGCEDKIVGQQLYLRIMRSLLSRVQKSKERPVGGR